MCVRACAMASAALGLDDAKRALKGVFPDAEEEEVMEALRRSGGRLEDAVDDLLVQRKARPGGTKRTSPTKEAHARVADEEDRVPSDPLPHEGRSHQVEEDEAYALRLQQQLYREGMRSRGSEIDLYDVEDDAMDARYEAHWQTGEHHDPFQAVRDGLSQVGSAIGSGLAYLYQSFAGEGSPPMGEDEEPEVDGEGTEDWEDEDEQEVVEDQVIHSTTTQHPRELRKRHVDTHREEGPSWESNAKKKGD